MARQLHTNAEIDDYLERVLGEARHHATQIVDIVELLAAEVRRRLNLAVDTIEVYERNAEIARTCWITLGGRRYVFTYNYDDECIDLKDRSIQGQLIFQFMHNTSRSAMRLQIAQL